MGSSSRSTRLWQIHSLVLRSATSYKNIMGSSTSRGGGQRMGWLGLAADNWWGPWLSGRVCCCCCCWRKTGEEHEGGNKRAREAWAVGNKNLLRSQNIWISSLPCAVSLLYYPSSPLSLTPPLLGSPLPIIFTTSSYTTRQFHSHRIKSPHERTLPVIQWGIRRAVNCCFLCAAPHLHQLPGGGEGGIGRRRNSERWRSWRGLDFTHF